MNNRFLIFIIAIMCIGLVMKAPASAGDGRGVDGAVCDIPACPDYRKDVSWASRPANPDKPVDVFYVYPTIYPKKTPKNMDVFNDELRSDVQGLLKAQAGAFSDSANLLAHFENIVAKSGNRS